MQVVTEAKEIQERKVMLYLILIVLIAGLVGVVLLIARSLGNYFRVQ
jgi:hypothetical protein